jgi:circadian clock protein KaiB
MEDQRKQLKQKDKEILANLLLKLYVIGQTTRTQRAISNLRRICEEHLGNDYELVIIDSLEQPHLAEEAKVLATPTLIREFPLPRYRIIGDLSNVDEVLMALNLQSPADREEKTT